MFVIIILFLLSIEILYPQTDSLYKKGLTKLEENDTSAAKKLFQESIKKYKDAPSYHELAKILVHEDRLFSLDNARGYMKEAIKIDPGNIEYRFFLGQIYERISKRSALEKFLKLDFNPRGEAIDTYKELLMIDPEYQPAHLRLAKLYKEDYYEYENLISYIEQPVYKYDLNNIVREAGDASAYNKFLNDLIISGQYPSINFNERANKFYNESVNHYQSTINYYNCNDSSYFELALLYDKMGCPDSGLSIVLKGLTIFMNNKDLNLAAAYLNYKVENYLEAKKYFDTAFF